MECISSLSVATHPPKRGEGADVSRPSSESGSHIPRKRLPRHREPDELQSALLEVLATPTMSIDFPKEEERILARWKEIDAFLRQVELVRLHNI